MTVLPWYLFGQSPGLCPRSLQSSAHAHFRLRAQKFIVVRWSGPVRVLVRPAAARYLSGRSADRAVTANWREIFKYCNHVFTISSLYAVLMADSHSPGSLLLEMSQVLHDKAKSLKAFKSKKVRSVGSDDTSEDEREGQLYS